MFETYLSHLVACCAGAADCEQIVGASCGCVWWFPMLGGGTCICGTADATNHADAIAG